LNALKRQRGWNHEYARKTKADDRG
jgi:hypothetical protein